MKRATQPIVLALAAALALAGCGRGFTPLAASMSAGKFHAQSLHAKGNLFSDHHLVVRMAPGTKPPIAGVQVRPTLTDAQIHVLPAGVSLDQAMAAYQATAGVLSIERLELYPVEDDPNAPPDPGSLVQAPAPQLDANDALYFQQYSHQVADVPAAWQVTKGHPDVVVASIDTGVDFSHPDLQGQVIDGPDFGENKPSSRDIDGHGTHVAGIIAAKANNGVGVAGVAPGCKVLALKVFEPYSENGTYKGNFVSAYSMARGIQYAVTQGNAKIINISASLANNELISSMLAFARGKGVVICVSAGNDGSNSYTGDAKTMDGVLVVHATNAANQLASFSNYGTTLAVSAPGDAILSTVPTYPSPFTGELASKTGYARMSGTSMASPFVAGVSALVVSALLDQMQADLANRYNKDDELTPADVPAAVVLDVLRRTCTDLGHPGRDEVFGCGLVNAGRAMQAATDPDIVERAVKTYLQASDR